MPRPSRRDHARHEAARALVAWLCDIPLEGSEIRTRPVSADEKQFVSLGFTRLTGEEDEKVKALLYSEKELTEAERAYLGRHLLVAVAGFVAEQLAGTTSQETTGADRRNAMNTAVRITGGRILGDPVTGKRVIPDARKPEFFQVLSGAEDRVRQLLAEHDGAWEALTGRLMHDGTLSGDEVHHVLTNLIGHRRGVSS